MDPNQNTPSSSALEGMVPIAQLEQLFRMFQPNFNISQALAALAPPPPAETATPIPAQTSAIPADSEAIPASAPTMELVEEVNPNEEGDEGVDEGAGVAPEMVEEELVLTDAEGVEKVRSRMASEDVEKSADNERVEKLMAEMREGRTPTVKGLERVETSGGRIETGEKEGNVIFYVSNSEKEGIQHAAYTEAQILSASRLRRKFLLEESDDEVQPPRVVVEVQGGGASCRKRKSSQRNRRRKKRMRRKKSLGRDLRHHKKQLSKQLQPLQQLSWRGK